MVNTAFKLKSAKRRKNKLNSGGIVRSLRHFPPSHYSLKVKSFSLLAKSQAKKYESGVFEAGGYKWRLILHPNGNKKANGKNHISLYLAIEDTASLPHRWEVNVKFALFVFNRLKNKYLTIQDAKVPITRFNEMKTNWGFAKLLALKTFKNKKFGYLVNDCCVFGAEVFVIQPAAPKQELLSMINKPANRSFTWKMKNFSKKDQNCYYSNMFTVGERNWNITVYPKGNKAEKGNSLSVFLRLSDYKSLPPKGTVYAKAKLRVLDQRHDKHVGKQISRWFSASSIERGFSKFMPLRDLYKVSKGFVMNDTLIVTAEILVVSVVKYAS